jgi:hypothetical protein
MLLTANSGFIRIYLTMADMTITCPHCSQRITCDVLWGGHTLPCPTCHKDLAVPAPAPDPAEEALVPKVPQGPPKLAMGARPLAQDPGAAPRVVPIRNLAPPPPKKKNPLVQALVVFLVLAVLGVAAYIGYPYIKDMMHKSDASSPSTGQSSTAGGATPVQEMNATMDVADSIDSAAPAPAPKAPTNAVKTGRQPPTSPAPTKAKR